MKSSAIKITDIFFSKTKLFNFILSLATKKPKKLILCYHRISSEADFATAPGLIVRPEDFYSQLEILSTYFSNIRLDELLSYRGNNSVFAITFDDGFRDNIVSALPILESLKMNAAFFICTDYIGSKRLYWQNALQALRRTNPNLSRLSYDEMRNQLFNIKPQEAFRKIHEIITTMNLTLPEGTEMMTEEDLTNLHRKGFEIYSHTKSHPCLAALGKDEVIEEIEASMKVIERILGSKVTRILAYPFGREETLPPNIDETMQDLNFEAGLIVKPSFYDLRKDGRYHIPRLAVDRDDSISRFRMKKIIPLSLK